MKHKHKHKHGRHRKFQRAPVMGGHWRLRQLRQFDFGFQYEEEGQLRVVIPLPGIGKEGLSVQAKERLISVSAAVKEEYQKYATRPQDHWEIVLQEKVLPETAKATYKDGILLVDLQLVDPAHDVESIEMEDE